MPPKAARPYGFWTSKEGKDLATKAHKVLQDFEGKKITRQEMHSRIGEIAKTAKTTRKAVMQAHRREFPELRFRRRKGEAAIAKGKPIVADTAKSNLERLVTLSIEFLGSEVKERMEKLQAEVAHWKSVAENNASDAKRLELQLNKRLMEKAGIVAGD